MTEEDVIQIIRDHAARQFPKTCGCCGKEYKSFAEFIKSTTHVGGPISLDAEEGDWQPEDPLGTIGMTNCACGSTLALSSEGMDIKLLWKLMAWVRADARAKKMPVVDYLAQLRVSVDRAVLGEM